MSVSAISNRWLNKLYKAIAIILVIIAVLISAVRLFLPYAHNYRIDYQNYINEQFNSHILIGSMNMMWEKSGPSLIVENISLLDTPSAKIFVKRIDLSIDFWRSLQNWKIITNDARLTGANAYFDKESLLNSKDTGADNTLIESVSDIFLQQIKYFSVIDSRVIVKNNDFDRKFTFSKFTWINGESLHQASGDVVLDGLTSNNLSFRLDLTGNQFSEMSGQVYLEAKKLNITPWLDKVFAISDEETYSSINFNSWFSIEQGQLTQVQLDLGHNEISWLYENQLQSIKLPDGDILLSQLNTLNNKRLVTGPLTFSTNKEQWQPLEIAVNKTNAGIEAYVSSLELFGLADLYPLFSGDLDSQRLLDEIAPVGKVSDLHLSLNEDEILAAADFEKITTKYNQGVPGIENVSGNVKFIDNEISINLVAENGNLDFGEHFKAPIPYDKLASALEVGFSDSEIAIKASDTEFTSDYIQLTADTFVSIPKDSPAEMSLLANVHQGNAEFASMFYPHLLMGDDLVTYLNEAIIDGQVSQAMVLFNGPLQKFPFNNHEGIFTVDAELEKSTFKFDSEWPSINGFHANLNFTNNSMLITGREGSLAGVDVTGVVTEIKELSGEQILEVAAGFKDTSPETIHQLMLNSPMSSSIGATLTELKISGDVSGTFALNLPLNDTDNAIASGTVDFTDNRLNMNAPEMVFENVSGELSFINDQLNTENITVLWRNLPLALDVKAKNNNSLYSSESFYQVDIGINAYWPELEWKKELPQEIHKYGQGDLLWQGQLALTLNEDDSFSYSALAKSKLTGIEFNLPEPFNKSQEQVSSVVIDVTGNDLQSVINAKVSDKAQFYGTLEHDSVQFSKAHVLLGNEEMFLPTSGFYISSYLPEASVEQWYPLVSDVLASLDVDVSVDNNELTTPILKAPEKISGLIGNIDVYGQALTDVAFELTEKEHWWQLGLNARETRSQVKIFPDLLTQGIDVDAEFIHFPIILEELIQAKKPESKNNGTTVKGTQQENMSDELVKVSEAAVDSKPTDSLSAKPASANTANKVAELAEQNIAKESPFDFEFFQSLPALKVKCGSCRYQRADFGAVEFTLERTTEDTVTLKNFRSQRDESNINLDATWQFNQQVNETHIVGNVETKDIDREVDKLGFTSQIKDSGFKSAYNLAWQGSPMDFEFKQFNGDFNIEFSDGYLAEIDDKGARFLSLLSLQTLVRKLKFDFRDMFSDGMFYDHIKGDFSIENGVVYTDNTKMVGVAGDLSIKGNTNLSSQQLDYSLSYKPNYTSSVPALAWIATLNPVTFLAGVALDGMITSKVVSEMKFELTGNMLEPEFKQVDQKTQNISVGRTTPPQIVENIPEDALNNKPVEPTIIKKEDKLPENKTNG